MKLLICYLLLFSMLFPLKPFFSKTEIYAGDLVMVVIKTDRDESDVTVFENEKMKKIYQFKNKKNYYFFFSGFDIQYFPKNITYRFKSTKSEIIKNFKINSADKGQGVVKLIGTGKKKLLNKPNDFVSENNFFHYFFTNCSDVLYWRKQWRQPLDSYRITSVFGKKRLYDNGRVKYHRGTDFGGVIGTKVYAVNNGIVRYAGKKKIRGNIIVIDHGSEVFSSYWHLNKIFVKKGTIVKKGKFIGELGTTGLATGPHLHWELRIGMVCVDGTDILSLPKEFLSF